MTRRASPALEPNPLWYRDAIIYEVHVRAFFDSNGDGIGDFPGLTAKLDYIADLGATAIWLLPFYPSPLRDDGYDIADYTSVHPAYGTLADFRRFVREAHRRGLRVITELVCNHTSDQHPWFQRARRAPPDSPHRRFYVWSDTPARYPEARIIFKDFETSNWTWDPVAGAYYWHRFYSHQPDLNFDHPPVRQAIFRVLAFWLELGVDGLRLDAVPYLYEREGTNCENLPETHAFLRELRARIDARFSDRMLIAEANQWPDDAAAYFGDGDECHMAFHFPLMPRMFMAIRMEDSFPIIDILEQTPPIPPTCQWALFLRNHDELTLEMVTDEERDYMYRVYAQDPEMRINLGIRRRLAPLLGNHRRRIELMTALLMSLPGTPVLYYGDEIGMGDNIFLGDRNGVRTPMQWSADRNAGFSTANRQRLYLPVIVDPEYHYEAVNVDAQQNNPHSLLWWTKRLIALRRRSRAFGRGDLVILRPDNPKVFAFLRRYEGERILIVANLSRFAQAASLDLRELAGLRPVEMFGRVEFPPVGDAPYFITLGPHGFYWFSLEPVRAAEIRLPTAVRTAALPALVVRRDWEEVTAGNRRGALGDVLASYLPGKRWFAGKARRIKAVTVRESLRLPVDGSAVHLAIVQVDYTEGDPETYTLPLAYATGEAAARVLADHGGEVIARVQRGEVEGVLYEALVAPEFARAMLEMLGGRRRVKDGLAATTTRAFRRLGAGADLPPSVLRIEQSNTSIVYGDRLILKLFRRLESGVNPELEIGRLLTERGFAHIPATAAALERRDRGEPMTVAVLQQFIPGAHDAWRYTLDALAAFAERVLAARAEAPPVSLRTEALLAATAAEPHPLARRFIAAYLEAARLLGERTAQLHLALAAATDDPAFAPEPVTPFQQRAMYQSMRNLLTRVCGTVGARRQTLPPEARARAEDVLGRRDELLDRFRAVLARRITARRIRCHGDYHLGQVLYTGRDFVIIDFEGEPARPLGERRLKRVSLRDVAGMVRSFHYAAHTALQTQRGVIRPEDIGLLTPWARFWYQQVAAAFLGAYLTTAAEGGFLPSDREELAVLLDAHLLEKAVYELGYELNNRPEWVDVPLSGIVQLLDG